MAIPPKQQDEEQLIRPKLRLRKAPRGTTVHDESHADEGVDIYSVYYQDHERSYEEELIEAREG